MKTKLLALSTALIFCITKQKAQISSYSFTQTLGTYGAANTGSMVGTNMQDDDVTNVSLPFTFTYNSIAYNNINVCSNGCLSFNTLNGSEYNPISDNTTQNIISAFGQDLFMGHAIIADMTSGSSTLTNCSSVSGLSVGDVMFDYNGDFSANPVIVAIIGNNIVLNLNAQSTTSSYDAVFTNGYIKQNVSGTAPNRICEFEFSNFTRQFTIYDETIRFKVRLYETSNVIEFLYGTMIPGSGNDASEVGLKGNNQTDFNSREVTSPTSWAASVASNAITDVCDFTSTLFPASGLSYKWTPVTCTTPTLSIVSSSSVSCPNQSLTLTVSGATSYTWANGSTTTQIVLSPAQTTTYSVIGANTTCTSSLTYTQNVAPIPTISISQSPTLTCPGQSVTLTASGASTYSWSGGPNTAVFVVSPTVTSSYTVSVSNGTCEATQAVTQNVSTCTGLSSTSLLNAEISAYPNPFKGSLEINNSGSMEVNIILIDALGKVVYTDKVKSDSTATINTEDLNKGFYFIRLNNGSEVVTKKLVKE